MRPTETKNRLPWLTVGVIVAVMAFLFFRPHVGQYYTAEYTLSYLHQQNYVDAGCVKRVNASSISQLAKDLSRETECARSKTIREGPDQSFTLPGKYATEAQCRSALAERQGGLAPNEHLARWSCDPNHRFTWGSSGEDSVALWSLWVAIVTLGAVGYQIHLASDELTYVKQDLENQREQMREFRRRPELSVNLRIETMNYAVSPGGERTDTLVLRPWCQNSGTLSTKEFRARLFFPVGEMALKDGDGYLADVGGKRYRVRDFVHAEKRLYPDNEVRFDGSVTVSFTRPFVVLWEVDDEHGHYPDSYLGAIFITAASVQADELPENARRKAEEIRQRQRSEQLLP